MSDSPLGLQLSLRSNANLSGYFCPRRAGTKIRENEPFSLTTRQAHASLVYPFLPRLCCHNKYRPTKADSTIESPFLPNQNATNKSSSNHKKAGYLSLLLLPSFCVSLHFDLLFCKLDFFQSQQHVQSLTSNIFCYPAS